VLFGDGAGAVVLQGQDTADRGILSTHLHSDGDNYDLLYVDGGPSTTGTVGHLRMEGRKVFVHAVQRLAEVVDEALGQHQLTPRDIDWLVPHQANKRIIDGVGRKLALDPGKVVVTVDRHANTSAASIPLAFAEAVHDGRIQRGQLVLLEAMGGGLSWGAGLLRW
jgi:3-oxoacyl-[acyl-carrier-protein] synthase-3